MDFSTKNHHFKSKITFFDQNSFFQLKSPFQSKRIVKNCILNQKSTFLQFFQKDAFPGNDYPWAPPNSYSTNPTCHNKLLIFALLVLISRT